MAIRVVGYNTTGLELWDDVGRHGGARNRAEAVALLRLCVRGVLRLVR